MISKSLPINTRIISYGYIKIKTKNGWNYEHRIVMEKKLKRRLTDIERIHHINGIKDDNRIENLQLTSIYLHSSLHSHKHPIVEVQCLSCREIFKSNRENPIYCSRQCVGKSRRKYKRCQQCQRFFRSGRHPKQRFCSSKCYGRNKLLL